MLLNRDVLLRRGLTLEYLSIVWNVAEAVVGVLAGVAAGSVALVGFGLDSVVEASSASILVWRLRVERSGDHSAEHAERTAIRAVAVAFFVLAVYVASRSVWDLVDGTRPKESALGIVLAIVSLIGMPFLAWRKRRVSKDLSSHAMHADSRQTVLCSLLSAVLLIGLVANAALGWWWADPAAGLLIAALAAREGHWLWTTEDPSCC